MNKLILLLGFLIFIQSLEVNAQSRRKKKIVTKAIYTQELGIDTTLIFTVENIKGKKFSFASGIGTRHIHYSGSTFKFNKDNNIVEISEWNCTGDTIFNGTYEIQKGNIIKISRTIQNHKIDFFYDILLIKNQICLIFATSFCRKEFVYCYKRMEIDDWGLGDICHIQVND